MNCLVVNYELKLIDIIGQEAVFTQRKFDRGVSILWSNTIYIVNKGNEEHLQFQKDVVQVVDSYMRIILCEEVCKDIEKDITVLLYKYKTKGCVYNDTEKDYYSVRHHPKTILIKNHLFDEYVKAGRLI